MPDPKYQSPVRKLLRAAILHHDHPGLVKYLDSEPNVPEQNLLLANYPQLCEKYWDAMVSLGRDLVPNHISSAGLYTSLWNLFREVVLNRTVYQESQKLDAKINEFCGSVKPPLSTFEVMYEVENLDVGSSHLRLGNVEIFKLTTDRLRSMGLNENALVTKDSALSGLMCKSVAKIKVSASESDRALESGIAMVKSALNVVKLVAVRQRVSYLDEEMFMWRLGRYMVMRQPDAGRTMLLTIGSRLGSRPLTTAMDASITQGLGNESTWTYILDGRLPEDINRRILRAMGWISHAITADTLDYRLVDLCTALEILLLPNHKSGTKGELIALRQVLLSRGEGAHLPTYILYLYDKRSSIIHSGALEITSYSEYWQLLLCCFQVLRRITLLSQQNPHVSDLERLLSLVQNKKTVEDFIKDCREGAFRGYKIGELRRTAEKLLKKY